MAARKWLIGVGCGCILALGAGLAPGCNLVLDIEPGRLAAGGAGDGGSSATTGGVGGVGGDGGTGGEGGTGGTDFPSCPPIVFTAGECDDAESLTDPSNCCVAGHSCLGGTCVDGACQSVVVGGPESQDEAIEVVIVGDEAVWATGTGATLHKVPVDGSAADAVFANTNSTVTRMATDGTDLYHTSFGGGEIQRVSVPGGGLTLVTTITDGFVGFGGIAVGDDYVYVAMTESGDVWRAAKDLSDVASPEKITDAVRPGSLVFDGSEVFFIENETAIVRMDPDGANRTPVIDNVTELGGLALDELSVFYGQGSTLRQAPRDGLNQDVIVLGSGVGSPRRIRVDDTYVYWTTADSPGAVYRARKDAAGSAELLVSSPAPEGLALTCDAIFFTDMNSRSLEKLAK